MTADSLTAVRELDCRWTNGIQVRLLWRQSDGRVSVSVTDTTSRESFCIDVPDGERPREVFYHPFAYAAHQRVERDLSDGLDVAGGAARPEDGSGARP
jgi:hypothetical protein